MKKLLFSLVLLAGVLSTQAQVVIWSDDFEDQDISDWTLLDEDGDGFNFIPYDPSIAQDGAQNYMSSQSYDFDAGALSPDNWTISQPIDISGATGLSLAYLVGPQDPAYPMETYSVYVSTGNTIADFEDSDVSFTENIGEDPAALLGLVPRELDLSSFDGESTIYVAFRHHDTTDMFYINFDDVMVTGLTLGVSDLTANTLCVYPNPVVDSFNVNLSSKFNANNVSVTITDLTGKTVKSFEHQTEYNVSELPKGVYIVKISDGKNTETKKILKK